MKSTNLSKAVALGQTRKLTEAQEIEILRLIIRYRPFQLRFKTSYRVTLFMWTRDLLMQLIFRQYQVELTESGLVKYLTRWGFPKVNRKETKQDQCDKTIRKWLDIHLESTIARSINEEAQIYWLGHTRFVILHAKSEPEKKYSYIPVISHQGRLHWLTITGRFNPKRQVMLLKSLVAQNRVKVFLIRKTATHFNTSLVKEWLLKNQHVLEILPPPEWFDE